MSRPLPSVSLFNFVHVERCLLAYLILCNFCVFCWSNSLTLYYRTVQAQNPVANHHCYVQRILLLTYSTLQSLRVIRITCNFPCIILLNKYFIRSGYPIDCRSDSMWFIQPAVGWLATSYFIQHNKYVFTVLLTNSCNR